MINVHKTKQIEFKIFKISNTLAIILSHYENVNKNICTFFLTSIMIAGDNKL